MAKLIESPDVFGSTVFCDETRFEVTGKLIHIGVYQGVISVHVPFPVRLPMFCFAISLAQRLSVFIPRITYRIFLPGDPDDASSDEASIIAETDEVNQGDMMKGADAAADALGVPGQQREFVRSFANLAFQTLEIKQPGVIKVRADIAGKRYKIGSIAVLPAPQAKNPSLVE
jgi:hypothetical protein